MKKDPAIFDKIVKYMEERETKAETILLTEMVKDLKLEKDRLYNYLNDLKALGVVEQDYVKTGMRGRPKTLVRLV